MTEQTDPRTTSPYRFAGALRRASHLLYAALIFGPLYLALGAALNSRVAGAFAAAMAVTVIFATHAHQVRGWRTRISAADSPAWDVDVNHIRVGTITDAEYATIRLKVINDGGLYLAQAGNYLRVVLNAIGLCVRTVPIGLFWIGVGLAAFAPDILIALMANIQTASASDIMHVVQVSASGFALATLATIGLSGMSGLAGLGYENRFDEAVGMAVRKHCKVPAASTVTLFRLTTVGSMFEFGSPHA